MTQQPSYLNLTDSELKNRAQEAERLLLSCSLCPWECRVNRKADGRGHCRAPAEAVMAGAGPHFGEEIQLSGTRGSGTVFFAHCNLDCVYCQNWELSHQNLGNTVSPEQLAEEMLKLQQQACHNINLVTPTPHIPAILSALSIAARKGLNIPLVYNCGGYEKVEVLRLLEGIVDIYLPDFKYSDDRNASRYSGIRDYPRIARKAIKEMHRQVGVLKNGPAGIARKGLIVRHLVLPENLSGTAGVLRFLSEEISPRTAVNIMDQYHPAFRAGHFPPLANGVTEEEFLQARKIAIRLGLRILD